MGIQEQGWVMNIIRSLFSVLDSIIYKLIKWILFGIFDLANITTNSEVFSGIYSRIYVILGIFMAFKLMFSFFQYIMDPESMTGKSEKSLSKLMTRVFIMLATLIFLPTILFGQGNSEGLLSRVQRAFLPTLPKVIFGVENLGGLSTSSGVGTGANFTDSIEQAADDIAVTTLSGFFAPPDDLDDYCDDGTYDKTPPITSIEEFRQNVNLDCPKRGDIGAHIDITGALAATGLASKYYRYSYLWFISTVVGVLIALLLLGITFDIAKRIFKLMILEVIAPIPIMSLIDPKGSKDGAFRKWVSSLTSTFLDIFFKLGLVYIIIVFIHLIVNSGANGGLFTNFPSNTGFRGTYLIVLLILGLILFAKEAPKFIKDAMGLKGDGAGLFDDIKTVGKAAGLVGGAAVGTAGVIGSTVGNIRAQHEGNQEYFKGQHVRNTLRNLGAGISGAVGGTAAAVSGLTGKDAGLKSVLKKQQERNASSFDYRRNGGTLFGRIGSNASRAFTGETTATRIDREISNFEAERGLIKGVLGAASGNIGKRTDTYGSFGSNAPDSLKGFKFNYRDVKSLWDTRSPNATEITLTDSEGNTHNVATSIIAANLGALQASNEADWMDSIRTANIDSLDDDSKLLRTYMDDAKNGGVKADFTKNGVRKSLKERDNYLERSASTQKGRQTRARANDKYSAKKK